MIKVFKLPDDVSLIKDFLNEAYKIYKDKSVSIEIISSNNIRSLEQNALYWGVLIPQVVSFMNESTGENYEAKEVHEFLKYNFGTKVYQQSKYYYFVSEKNIIDLETWENLPQKEAKEYTKVFQMPTTRTMSTKKFKEYLDLIIDWAAMSNFQIEL